MPKSTSVVWHVNRDHLDYPYPIGIHTVRKELSECLGLTMKADQDEYIDKCLADGYVFILRGTNRHGKPVTRTISPPRVDQLQPVVDCAIKNDFALRDTDLREGHVNLFNIKRGVKIETHAKGLIFKRRKGRKYTLARTYKVDGPAPQYIMNPDKPEELSNRIRRDIEEMKGDEIKRDDLFHNMLAHEVRELLPEAHVKIGLNRARSDQEQCKLQYRGTWQCILDPEVRFNRLDGQHKGTFTIQFNINGEIIVTSQLRHYRKWTLSPEQPEYTPENIAAWIRRCLEADVRLATLQQEYRIESNRLTKDLKNFIKET